MRTNPSNGFKEICTNPYNMTSNCVQMFGRDIYKFLRVRSLPPM